MSERSNNTAQTRVGLIGAGSIALGAHLPGFLANSDVEIIAVADPVEGRAARFASNAGIDLAFTDFRELLNHEDVDAVSIATPPVAHAETTIAALEAGKHVFCEKPMAMNANEAIAMEQAALKANRVLAIDFQSRFEWDTQEARRLVTTGMLGKPHFARASYLRRAGVPTWGTFTSKTANGGGALIDIGVHALDRALYVLGHPTPTSVWGATGQPFGQRGRVTNRWGPWNTETYDVDDYAFAAIRFTDDLILLLECSWILRMEKSSIQQLEVSATDSGLALNPLRLFHDRNGSHSTETFEPPSKQRPSHELSIADFVHAVRENIEPTVPASHGVLIAKIVDAIYRSMTDRTEVQIT
jgi:predicted dehydrogenase